jgi:hypothetical protein
MEPIRVGGNHGRSAGRTPYALPRDNSFRVRTRAQMVLLAAEKGLVAHEVASIVRRDEQAARRWIERCNAR